MIKINGKKIFNISVMSFSIGLLIYFCVSENGLVDLMHNITDFNKIWLSTALFCHVLNIFIDAYLTYRFTKSSNSEYSFKEAFKVCMVGQFFSAITPGASGGQPMQLYCMANQGIDPGNATSSLVQKFLVYQSSITMYSTVSLILKFSMFRENIGNFMKGMAVFGFCSQAFVILLLILFSFNKSITFSMIKFIFLMLGKLKIIKNPEQKIKDLEIQIEYFYISNSNLYKKPMLVLETYFFTIVQITCMFVVPYCIYRAFNIQGAKVFDMIAAQAFVTMISSFMPLPGGSGAAEGSFCVFLNQFFSEQTIKPAVLLWRVITYFFTILMSFPFSRVKNKTLEVKSNAQHS